MPYRLPSENGRISIPNEGDNLGNVFTSYGLDYDTNRGALTGSTPLKKIIDETDDADLDSYAAQFVKYKDEIHAITDKVFVGDAGIDADITDSSEWEQDDTSNSPTVGNTVTDAIEFDGLLLVVDGDDIKSYNGSAWASWWQTTLGQTALTTGQRFFMEVGADGNLYIVDDGNKIYRVTPAGTVTKSGQGTLDFSARDWVATAMEATSSRLFIAFKSSQGRDEAYVVEWDMGPQSISPNRTHKMGSERVDCLPVWEDVPYAILSDGRVKYFNGERFVNYKGVRFPKFAARTKDTWVHNNGWAIIDDLVHILCSPITEDPDRSAIRDAIDSGIENRAGVWCMDPEIGLYNRFPLTNGGTDFSQLAVSETGALFAIEHENTKFLASYEFFNDATESPVNTTAGLFAEDSDIARARTGYLVTPFVLGAKGDKMVQAYHDQLQSGEQFDLYYRRNRKNQVAVTGWWLSDTLFNTTESVTGISVGDFLIVSIGPGGGHISRVAEITSSSSVTSIRLQDANPNYTSGAGGALVTVNFKYMGTYDNTVADYHESMIPTVGTARKIQLLLAFKQAVSSQVRLDNVIID